MQATSKLYSNASNAKRAARIAFPEGNFELVKEDGKFGFRGLAIEITAEGEKLVHDDADLHVEAQPEPAPAANPFAGMVAQATGEAAALVNGLALTANASLKHTLNDHQHGCPLCGASEASVTYVDGVEDNRRQCHECGERFNAVTGQRIRSGYKNENVSRGHKIQKDRPCQNGVKRPSDGTQCAAVWTACDELGIENSSAKALRTICETNGWNLNNTLIEYYNWRKFNGVTGRAK